MSDFSQRLDAVERAVLVLAAEELGAQDGHPFYGNQYSGGGGEGPSDEWIEPSTEGASQVADDIIADGPPAHVGDREQWELGVSHGANYLENGDQIDSVEALQEFAREQLQYAREEPEMMDTHDPRGEELSDPEAYFEGILSLADAMYDNR